MSAFTPADLALLVRLLKAVEDYCDVSEVDMAGTAAEERYDEMKALLWQFTGRKGDPKAWRST